MKLWFGLIALVALAGPPALAQPQPAAAPREAAAPVIAPHAMVSAANPLAANAGLKVLREGGSRPQALSPPLARS